MGHGKKKREKRRMADELNRATGRSGHPEFRLKQYDAVPPWASALHNLAEYQALARAVENALRLRWSWFEEEGEVLRVHAYDGRVLECHLQPLATRCSTLNVQDYVATVGEHFARLLGPPLHGYPASDSLDQVRDSLKIRIYTDAYFKRCNPNGSKPITRRLAPDLNAVVVIDMPNLAASLSRDLLPELHATEEEVYQAAVANHRSDPVERMTLDLGQASGFALFNASRHANSQILHLERHLVRPAPWGVLVIFTHRDILTCVPIDPAALNRTMADLILQAEAMYEELKGNPDPAIPMTRNLYWWRPGSLVHIPAFHDEEMGVVTRPPEEFLSVVFDTRGPTQPGGKLPS